MDDRTGSERWVMDAGGLEDLVDALVDRFDDVIGPVLDDGVIRLAPIRSADDLPVGVVDAHDAGSYRTEQTPAPDRFSYGPGPDSLKALVHPPTVPVWTMRRRDGRLLVDSANVEPRQRAVVGVRSCDLAALDVLDRTRTHGPHPDRDFAARRAGLFVVAVDCSHPARTCWCRSMGHGPAARGGFDLALTELPVPGGLAVEYLVRAGSERGMELVDRLGLATARTVHLRRAAEVVERAHHRFERSMPPDARASVMAVDHPRWSEVADRCLTCGNCTAVCPTCFCTDVHDQVSLDGSTATRNQVWDSCFGTWYSTLGGRPHRGSAMSRYRQWLTHKLGTWHDQFGESGCVGCGRCVTWCPVGIDITAEVEALRPRQEATS